MDGKRQIETLAAASVNSCTAVSGGQQQQQQRSAASRHCCYYLITRTTTSLGYRAEIAGQRLRCPGHAAADSLDDHGTHGGDAKAGGAVRRKKTMR